MEKLKKDNLGELVYQQIASMMLNRDLLPGEKINRKELAMRLGVSQTPVNEAIIRFVNEGVVEQVERQGFFLKVFTDNDMKELFAVRAGLEGVALRLCVEGGSSDCLSSITHLFDEFSLPLSDEDYGRYQQADRTFHEQILLSSSNSIIIDFVKNFDFILKCYQKGLIRSPEETLQEHKDIIQAIRDSDAERAQNLLMAHHLRTRDYINHKHLK